MKINKKELLDKLNSVKAGLNNNNNIEFSDSYSFNNGKVTTFNDFICVHCPVDLNFDCMIKAEQFHKALSKFKTDKDGNININLKNNEIHLKGKKALAGIPCKTDESFDVTFLNEKIKKWNKLPTNFVQGIKLARFSISKDETKPKLTCLHIKNKIIESNDGQRGFRFKLDKKMKNTILLPAQVINPLLSQNLIKYAVTENWIHFKTKEKSIISCRMYQDIDYPDTAFLYERTKAESFTFPQSIKDIIDKSIIFVEKEDEKEITIKINEKSIEISSRSDLGWFKEKVKNKSDINTTFQINPFFMKDILNKKSNAFICNNEDISFIKFETEEWEHVISIKL